jgi:hypothetical protein
MQSRLLSLLAEIESAIRASQPGGDGASLESSRMVNFHTGLARLTLRAHTATGPEPRGQLQMQHFNLADGRACVKIHLTWAGSDSHRTIEIYTLPGLDWRVQVNRVAEAWLDGPVASDGSGSAALAATG